MNPIVNIDGKPAVRIDCKIIADKPTYKAILIKYCDEEFWIPRAIMRDNKDGTIDLQEWFYENKMNS
jgi:hypothetical protein